MNLLQIALSLLLVLTPIACAYTHHKITPDEVSNIKYGMEISEVQKVLGSQGNIRLKWAEKGESYFVIRYNMGLNHKYYLVFKDDIFASFIKQRDFIEAFKKHVVPSVGKLPFENGFEPLYVELVSEKYKFSQFKVYEDTIDSKDYKLLDYTSGEEELLYSVLLSPISVPYHVFSSPLLLLAPTWIKFQNKFNKLSIGTSKEAVIKLLGQPKWSYNSVDSDYEIIYYIWNMGVGLRDGKVEWTFKEEIETWEDLDFLQTQLDKFEEDRKTLKDNE